MNQPEATFPASHDIGPHAELLERISDFIQDRSRSLPGKLDALLETVQTRVQSIDLRASLEGLISRWKERALESEQLATPDWELLVTRIREHGRQTSIENYSLYLFSMDGLADPARPSRRR